MDGLTRSLLFVPLVSASACSIMNELRRERPKRVDNVLLEWETALHLKVQLYRFIHEKHQTLCSLTFARSCSFSFSSSLPLTPKTHSMSGLQAILPIFVGKAEAESGTFWDDGSEKELNSLPRVVHGPTRNAMQQHLERTGFKKKEDAMSVHEVINTIMKVN
jgi:hypothetical protein